MFKHVIYESWLSWVPWTAFGVMATIYLTCTFRSLQLRKETTERLSRLPLDD